ncbi:unnamed protein product [Allacma fusca]|uniref:non-specific serine/threonine protein kinase n=1 Tax=Allacma fusca TaxID=39272 RepID=A0A8J2LL58_9HEXA|nr:unnamed protein product [Allacma fusca]
MATGLKRPIEPEPFHQGSAGTSGTDSYFRKTAGPLYLDESLGDDSDVDIESLPDEDTDPEFPVLSYSILCLILILWGLIGIGVTISLETSHSVAQEFLLVDRTKLYLPSSILYSACIVCVLTGIVAIICIICESSIFFPIFPQLNGLVVGLNCMASLCAYDGWTTVNTHTYQHLLEADTLSRYTGDNSYIKIFGDRFIGYWDKLQTTLRCCGLEDHSNWLNSTCQCIPGSCCLPASKPTCINRLAEFHSSSSANYKNMTYVQSYLWKKDCMGAINQEIASLKRDWVSFPIILLVFHLILMFNINFMVVAARSRYNLVAGFISVARWKDGIVKRFKWSYRYKNQKVHAEDNAEPIPEEVADKKDLSYYQAKIVYIQKLKFPKTINKVFAIQRLLQRGSIAMSDTIHPICWKIAEKRNKYNSHFNFCSVSIEQNRIKLSHSLERKDEVIFRIISIQIFFGVGYFEVTFCYSSASNSPVDLEALNNNYVNMSFQSGINSRSLVPGSGSSNSTKYVYDLPYFNRKELCRVLDENNQWETVGGGYMGYSSSELSEFGRSVFRGASPTDSLLTAWGSQNHTILELFVLLRRLNHFRGMRLLADFVDPKYHVYIRDPDQNATVELIQLNSDHDDRGADPKPVKIPDAAKGEVADPKAKENILDEKRKYANLAESFGMLPQIPYSQLVVATKNWDRRNILGKGGFGTVFKGVWKATDVAIKRMERRGNHDTVESQMKQSLGELRFLNAYRHDNILPLYGYSLVGEHPCLVYQFMHNGSLEDRLLCRQKTPPLSWSLRYSIARGVARGIQFLHSISDEKPLIHGDIKSANILLDRNFDAKIGDFGLAREMAPAQGASYVRVSRVHGTRPYLPDEYLRSKKLSPKVDTFSFGIMLYEICCGQRAYEEHRPKKFLKDMVEEAENVENIRDIKGGQDTSDIFLQLITLGKNCTRRIAKDRPEMSLVLKSIEGFFTQPSNIRTVSSHVTGLPFLFETPSRAPSLVPTATSVHRLSPEIRAATEMRAVSPYWTPPQPQHVFMNQYGHQVPLGNPIIAKPPQTDSIASSPRRSPLSFVPHSPSPSPQSYTNPVTLSDNNQQSNPQQMNITGAEQQLQLPHFVGFVPSKNLRAQPLQPQPRMPIPTTIAVSTPPLPIDDDYFPLVLQDQESNDCDGDKRDFDCSQGPATVIPLITELGIKDTNSSSEEEANNNNSSADGSQP